MGTESWWQLGDSRTCSDVAVDVITDDEVVVVKTDVVVLVNFQVPSTNIEWEYLQVNQIF